ncbi:MAG: rRNA pseudouridine synthase [Rickettsiales bacterium]|jgi:23S rRNA pseudouridine2605 synthase|nr:rRNA pseudouridine synthase [Rickettsiales bacterium]
MTKRIAKAIADAGVCSRRDAEKLVLAGKVSANGERVPSPAFNVEDADEISIDGKALPLAAPVRLYAYHKPAGLVVSHRDERGRESVFDRLPSSCGRLLSVGRLDINSEGLLLLTNSGTAQRMLEKGDFPRVYRVRMRGLAKQFLFDKLARGMTVGGIRYKPIHAEIESAGATNTWLRMTLREGKNREIRRALGVLGHEVSRLIRVSYAGIELGDLRPGELREVNMPDIAKLG